MKSSLLSLNIFCLRWRERDNQPGDLPTYKSVTVTAVKDLPLFYSALHLECMLAQDPPSTASVLTTATTYLLASINQQTHTRLKCYDDLADLLACYPQSTVQQQSLEFPRSQHKMILKISHLILMLLASWTALAIPVAPDGNANTTAILNPRQCVWNSVSGTYDCDYHLPSVGQFVTRMQDTPNKGKASSDAVPFFYVGLYDTDTPTTDQVALVMNWCTAWLTANGITSFYSTFNSLDNGWQAVQNKHVTTNVKQCAQLLGVKEEFIPWFLSACYNQALAFAVRKPDAEVYLFTKAGVDWYVFSESLPGLPAHLKSGLKLTRS